ncbi:uncharacterized protein MELLADRAFT_92402 [Melampsora larici-populina 98AG31]|uniref:Uncharacterized protein n=1 Tax=Melampsora larici-populina (strain 98AG31 / pathotype 3-4-7) TaxID=747676 RepID=F4R9I2_MELLP|nr:uncharacterized protein MELLADRAFT_92402 [Melampsora larici-populina 98AG31]EGG11147.1 hypothetical protein MELLADRAFT_92402 [Melampsora larici-populina 98AG31]
MIYFELTLSKTTIAKKTQDINLGILEEIEKDGEYRREYFAEQWERQKAIQSQVIGDNDLRALELQLQQLIEFEEDLREHKDKLVRLRRRKRTDRTAEDLRELASLPGMIVYLKEEIQEVVSELGSERFRNIPQAKALDPKGKALIRIRIAKQNLYEAKVGVIELKRRWDEPGQATYESFDE